MTKALSSDMETKLNEIIANLDAVDSDDRRWAVYDLEGFDHELTIDHLVTAIQDENRAVREAASEVLETVPAEICTKKLTPLLGSDRIEIRNIVASVLVKYGETLVDDLLPALFHENEDVRKFTADILGLTHNDKAVAGLCKASLYDDVENVSVAAVEALGKIGSSEALPVLYKVVNGDRGMRAEAIEGIGLTGDHESTEFLEQILNDKEPVIVFAIIEALGNIGSKSSISVLKDHMLRVNPLLKEQICVAVLKIGRHCKINVLNDGGQFLEETVNNLSNKRSELEDLVIYQLKLDPSIELIKFLFEHSIQLSSTLLVSLINSTKGDIEFLTTISSLVKHEDDWVAYTALEMLGAYKKDAVKDIIISVLNLASGMRVIAAIKLSVKMKLKEAVSALKVLQQNENEDISSAAERAINEI